MTSKQSVRMKPLTPCSYGTFRKLKRTQDDHITPQDTRDMLCQRSKFSTSRRRPRSRPEACTRSTHANNRKHLGTASSVPPPPGTVSTWRRRQTPNQWRTRPSAAQYIGPHGEHMGEQPSPRLPQPQTSSSPPNQHDGDMAQHRPKPAPLSPAHHPDLAVCPVYLSARSANHRLTRWLETILTSRTMESTRSCGWRAPRQVIRARSGGLKGG